MRRWIPAVAMALVLTGCSFGRPDIAILAERQNQYYDALTNATLKHKELLETGLKEQLKTDLVRDRNILEWNRDLEKAAILLQQDPNVTKNQLLLMMSLSESQLASLEQMQALQTIDEARANAIIELYDAVIEAARALKKNNDTIASYLGSGDASFAIRSLDVEGIARAVTAVRRAGGAIDEADEAAAEERKEGREKLGKNIERAREVLLKALGEE